jgi:cyclopropane-fatty-acyl-phospholipid synthase
MTVVEAGQPLVVDPQRWPDLVRVPPAGFRARMARRFFARLVTRLPLRVVGTSGRRLGGGGGADAPVMRLLRPAEFFARLGSDGLIGFGEAYQAGAWDAEDVAEVLAVFARRLMELAPHRLPRRVRSLYNARVPVAEEADLEGALRNVERHYDLSNDLFELFLDDSMTYSSALFGPQLAAAGYPDAGPPDPGREQHDADDELHGVALRNAQMRKVDAILDAAGVREGSRVLEIGSGWGALAMRAAGERGATVTTLTLSREQKALAEARIAAAGLSDRIEVRFADYREVAVPPGGGYDAVVSVEMIEAVGEKYVPDYFQAIDRLMAPDGRAAIQAITMAHQRMLAVRSTYTWLQKYIFPGGLILSVQAMEQAARARTPLRLVRRLDFGEDYAQTLRTWRERFDARWSAAHALGFDDVFRRTWRYYLASCEAAFRTGYLGVSQLTFAR